jgi:molybdopterin-guanine dinucleotide biosynthesis protein MobB
MLIPTICVVGSKDSGKTTVTREIIAEMSHRGLRVAAAKHSHHDFNFSAEGRDTTLFTDAGAESVIFIGKNQTVCTRYFEEEEKLKVALARYAADADVLIAEGWRKSALPKVLVFLEEEKAKEREFPVNVKAVVCPVRLDIEAPHFKPDEIPGLVDFLLAEVLEKSEHTTATIAVNGKYLPAKGFVQNIVASALLGMISSLKGADSAKTIEISVRVRGE